MAQIINLNKARKARARATAVDDANANRARFGRTKAQKARDDAARALLQKKIDDAKLD